LVTFAERLKQLRNETGVTMEDLAEEIGTTKSTISRYENNKREPKKHFIEKTADYFGVSTDYLLGLTNNRSNADKIKKAISDDPELQETWEQIAQRENLQLLFKQTKDLDDKAIKQIIRIIKAIEDEEANNGL